MKKLPQWHWRSGYVGMSHVLDLTDRNNRGPARYEQSLHIPQINALNDQAMVRGHVMLLHDTPGDVQLARALVVYQAGHVASLSQKLSTALRITSDNDTPSLSAVLTALLYNGTTHWVCSHVFCGRCGRLILIFSIHPLFHFIWRIIPTGVEKRVHGCQIKP